MEAGERKEHILVIGLEVIVQAGHSTHRFGSNSNLPVRDVRRLEAARARRDSVLSTIGLRQ